MFNLLKLGNDVIVLDQTQPNGSEVLLFRKNKGFVARLKLREKGDDLRKRLDLSVDLMVTPHGSELGLGP